MKKRVVLLGATGSIGKNTQDVIKRFPDLFELVGFSYHGNKEAGSVIASSFPKAVSVSTFGVENVREYESLFLKLFERTRPDIVVNGIAGARGLTPSFVSLENGIDLALANKESVVLAYDILKKIASEHDAKIIPVDSEHWAIFQLLNMRKKEDVEKIIITASGGAFRDVPSEKLKDVSLSDCFNHPTWSMGRKITIDSATLANKALEVIEATKLFSFSPEKIDVTIHKESIVHSMVQTFGGTIYAQCSPPDMRMPILGALMFPCVMPSYLKPLDFSTSFSFSFSPPRYDDFPLLRLGFEVAKKQSAYPIAFNASNEIAVAKFMERKISFLDVSKIVCEVLQKDWKEKVCDIAQVYAIDGRVREVTEKVVKCLCNE
ncbi:MAG: 1-deoxy-D-xylulose-5-phosphate reductoisomerase [Treponema sp.]